MYYITSPIFYVNDVPHIGHFYNMAICNTISIYQKMWGMKVHFMTGTDEHGQKIATSAAQKNMHPQDFVDLVAQSFVNLAQQGNIQYTVFRRTTAQDHKDVVLEMWNKLHQSGAIYLGKYEGWYAVRDEAFYDQHELIDGKAPTGAEVKYIQEECYFFNLSQWQNKLLDFYQQHPDFVKPSSRYNEVISFVSSGLRDLAVSRLNTQWGISVPDSNHVIYVWLDALMSYISGTNHSLQDLSAWPADLHVVGKDILRFHAVYWPAFLMAAELHLPKCILAHGWWLSSGEKMSKSLGNVIDPIKLLQKYEPHYLTYFMLKEMGMGQDGDFSEERMVARIESDLANKIGNFFHRMLSMAYKHSDSKRTTNYSKNQDVDFVISKHYESFHANMRNFAFNKAIDNILDLADWGNKYVDLAKPWELVKTDIALFDQHLMDCLKTMRYIAVMLMPFAPAKANELLQQIKATDVNYTNIDSFEYSENLTIDAPKAVFLKSS